MSHVGVGGLADTPWTQSTGCAASLPVFPWINVKSQEPGQSWFLSRNLLNVDTALFIFGVINNVLGVGIRFINASITQGMISHRYVLPRGNRLPGPSVLDQLLSLKMAPQLSAAPFQSLLVSY